MELGSHIKEHRTELGLSQDDLAERIYVSRQTISAAARILTSRAYSCFPTCSG